MAGEGGLRQRLLSPLRAAPLTWAGVLVLCGAGLALRIWMAGNNQFPSVDGVFYQETARDLLLHQHLNYSCFPPGWPLLMAIPLSFQDLNDPLALLRSAQIGNVVLGALFPLLTFFVLRPRLGDRLALLGMAMLVILPRNAVLARGDLSEMSYACGLLGAWLLLQHDRKLPAGLLFGYTYLIRPEALLAAAGLGLWLLWRDRRPPWTFALGVLAPMLPYLVFLRQETGGWDLSSKTVAVELSLQAHPGWRYPGLVWMNLSKLVPLLWGMIGLPVVLLAVWGAVRRPGAWLWMLAPLLPVPFIINPMVERFWIPYLPFLLLAAGLAGRSLVERFAPGRDIRQDRRLNILPRTGLVAGLLVLVLAGQGWALRDDTYLYRFNTETYHGLKQAGVWLRENESSDVLVAAYKPYASYWAGCRFIKYPDLPDAVSLASWARNNGARYMVVNVSVVHHMRPGLDDLLVFPTPPHLANRVELVRFFKFEDPAHNTAIYRLRD